MFDKMSEFMEEAKGTTPLVETMISAFLGVL